MLLVTLGYDATKAGLVGTNWAAKTNALADENGLLEDVNTSFRLPRQYAAQLIYNASTPRPLYGATMRTPIKLTRMATTRPSVEVHGPALPVEGILTLFQEDGKETYGATVSSITKKDGDKGYHYWRIRGLYQDC